MLYNYYLKNRKNLRSLILCLLLVLSIALNAVPVFADEEAYFKFAAMSDLHLDDIIVSQRVNRNRSQFKTALSAAVNLGYDDLFICAGDVSSYGQTSVWNEAKNNIENAGYTNLLWALGNHEYGTLDTNHNADSDFKAFTGQDAIYSHKVYNGCHFICFGVEECDIYNLSTDYVYSQAQEAWILEEIKKASEEASGKPIFVISHYPLKRTRIADELAEYDNIFFFWGHQHDENWENYSIDQYIDTSHRYTTSRVGCPHYGKSDITDVLLVDVFTDRVVLTINRTEGKTMNPNSVTINLTLPECTVLYDGARFYWYVPNKYEDYVIICSYDEQGQFISCGMIPVDDKYHECLAINGEEGISKAFFIDSNYVPYGEVSEFNAVFDIN